MTVVDDEFTRERSIRIEPRSFSHGPAFAWVEEKGQVSMELRWSQPGRVDAVVFQGDTLMLKLENEQLLVLESNETAVGVHTTDQRGEVVTISELSYRVSPEQLRKIADSWVTKLRLYFRSGYQERSFVIDPKWQYEHSRSARALLEWRSQGEVPTGAFPTEEAMEGAPDQVAPR